MGNGSIWLRNIDEALLAEVIVGGQRYLGGSYAYFYTAEDEQWIWKAPKLNLGQSENDIKIFPVGLVNYEKIEQVAYQLEDDRGVSNNSKVSLGFLGNWKMTFGRIFMPVTTSENNQNFAIFDIVMQIQPVFKWSDLFMFVLISIGIYLFFNYFLIQRMTSFGLQINKIIVQKFEQLRNGLQEISQGNLDYKLEFVGDDEFVELGERFNSMGGKLRQTIDAQREKDRLQFELQSARNVQLSLLPQVLPIVENYEIAATLHTATEVGGDFYDAFPLKTDESGVKKVLFTIGDVSGKGSSAALYMAQCMSLIRFASQTTENPIEICQRLNSYFANKVEDKHIFVTLIVGVLDIESHQIEYVRCGHTEPLFLYADETKPPEFLKSKGLGIGLTKSDTLFAKTLELVTLELKQNEVVLYCTDGIIEASVAAKNGSSDEAKHFEENEMVKTVAGLKNRSANEIITVLDDELDKFYGKNSRLDDHTLLAIRRL